ncbi:MAG: carbohydrate ABC transporter permease [Candidatus Dormibacteraeota bacterium]|nr:carbohydrate ABC transporter permease [Candidatus Dormibacteraeota bacterium]
MSNVRRPGRRHHISWGRMLVSTILVVSAVLFVLVPIWIVVVTSFKPLGEAKLLSIELPRQWQIFENYSSVIEDSRFFHGLWNSLVITAVSVAACLIFGSMASWVFARSQSRFIKVMYLVAIAGILVPAAIVPSIALLRVMGLQGTQPGLVVVYVAGMIAVTVFIITGFVRTIPVELEDAARIDGCSEYGVFFRIILPLLTPALISVTTLLTILTWTEFFSAFLILNGREAQTLPLGLWYVSSGAINQVRWNFVFTHVVLVSVPLVVFYFFAQRRLQGGILAGSLKG